MEIKGQVIKIMPVMTGEGANGEWRKQDVVINPPGEYSKPVAVTMWNDKIVSLTEGQTVTASINIESREYDGKWYTNIKAWKIVVEGGEPARAPAPAPAATSTPAQVQQDDDLPF